VGGEVSYGPLRGGGFRVLARLPMPRADQPGPPDQQGPVPSGLTAGRPEAQERAGQAAPPGAPEAGGR
jgi:hypothetical protein